MLNLCPVENRTYDSLPDEIMPNGQDQVSAKNEACCRLKNVWALEIKKIKIRSDDFSRLTS
jgi:hypothetical protein